MDKLPKFYCYTYYNTYKPIFNQNTIIDKSTFDFPHQYPEGIYYVIVNGQLAIDNEEFKNIKAGNILRKNTFKESLNQ